MPPDMWIDGDDIANDPGWSGAAPFNPNKPKNRTNGEVWLPGDAQVLRDLLHPVARLWLDTRSAELRGDRQDGEGVAEDAAAGSAVGAGCPSTCTWPPERNEPMGTIATFLAAVRFFSTIASQVTRGCRSRRGP